MKLEINKMQLSDLEQISDKLQQEFDDFWTPNILKQELENKNKLNSYYIVAKQNHEIVGFAGIIKVIDEIHIMNIVVKKDKRNKGIGSDLLKEIINISTKLQSKAITLEVNENNEPAIKLYKKYGFNQVGLRKKYYNNTDNAILMTLTVKKS